MRSNPASSMQKTYDECFLVCSTAIYFESQNNEAEALRSWRNALDQIYYHNAYRMPAYYRPRSETERALFDSLRQLELQCKERVDLLEALKKSRDDSKDRDDTLPTGGPGASTAPVPPPHASGTVQESGTPGWLGGGTIPPISYPDLSRPPLPQRPALPGRKSSGAESVRARNKSEPVNAQPSSTLSIPQNKTSRTPSPEKKGMLRTLRPGGREGFKASAKLPSSLRSRPPVAAKAATLAWGPASSSSSTRPIYTHSYPSKESIAAAGVSSGRSSIERQRSTDLERPNSSLSPRDSEERRSPFYLKYRDPSADESGLVAHPDRYAAPAFNNAANTPSNTAAKLQMLSRNGPPTPPKKPSLESSRQRKGPSVADSPMLVYRNEYPYHAANSGRSASASASHARPELSTEDSAVPLHQPVWDPNTRKLAVAAGAGSKKQSTREALNSTYSEEESLSDGGDASLKSSVKREKANTVRADLPPTPTSQDSEGRGSDDNESNEWKQRVKGILKNLPKGVDEAAAKQILNEIVIHGDEVHWDDVAGLEVAKSALKENVVYPFLRPDLFMGLREPARGMLLFGPPGTGKTMLARAVATESRSTFFAISASSLTSKFLGESEKLVRALFALAKALAPSIIFVDEIDSLLSARSGSGEHEATRRIKTEFLIQWSDLQKAAAGREQSERDKERGDASRVLVLAATNLPWAIDEAARRRFVRRQYIPLPEDHVRKSQIKTLMSHQKHNLTDRDIDRLVALTEGFSGSDITALAKDAAMGPLRSLGEKLLHMTMDEIRPIRFEDFQASLQTIRPSVSKQGLKEFEDWARQFGERGG